MSKQKPKMSRNRKRKDAYAKMGRERGDHAGRNAEIDKMTTSGAVLLEAGDPEAVQAAEEAVVRPSSLGTGETSSQKRARLKAARATGKMPKRKWEVVDGKSRRVRTRAKLPGTHAHYLANGR